MTQLMVLGTEGGLSAEHGLLGRTRGLPEPQTSISSPEIWYPRPGKGGKKGLCVCGCLKGLWDFKEDIKSLL